MAVGDALLGGEDVECRLPAAAEVGAVLVET